MAVAARSTAVQAEASKPRSQPPSPKFVIATNFTPDPETNSPQGLAVVRLQIHMLITETEVR
jgi:hypothetical protein